MVESSLAGKELVDKGNHRVTLRQSGTWGGGGEKGL